MTSCPYPDPHSPSAPSASKPSSRAAPIDARQLYAEAWDASDEDHDHCVAAHYVAHLKTDL
ncbi:MAG: hypothetical protein ACH37Z_19040 [Anaerolineae bacterium]